MNIQNVDPKIWRKTKNEIALRVLNYEIKMADEGRSHAECSLFFSPQKKKNNMSFISADYFPEKRIKQAVKVK